jgi:hypothetical protein
MLETLADFFGNIAVYIVVLLGLVALYFLWVAFREWRTGNRAAFGIERDIATGEMIGAIIRAGGVVVVALIVLALGQLSDRAAESPNGTPEPLTGNSTAVPTTSVFRTLTPAPGDTPVPPALMTDTPAPEVEDVPPLPGEETPTSEIAPTPQTARVTAFGGVWLRDAPNGGTIGVLPQESVVEFRDGREAAGDFTWQRVLVLQTPPGGQALEGQEGWVAAQFLEVTP